MPVSERLLAQLAKFREHWNNTKRKVEEEKPRPFLLADLRDVSVAPDVYKEPEEKEGFLQKLFRERIIRNPESYNKSKNYMFGMKPAIDRDISIIKHGNKIKR